MTEVARHVIGIFSKYLISSEAKYHTSCYKSFVRINYSMKVKLRVKQITFYNHKVVKELFLNKARELRVTVLESDKKNHMRKVSNMFPEINFVTYQYNKMLMYPNTLAKDETLLDFFVLKTKLELPKGPRSDDAKRRM